MLELKSSTSFSCGFYDIDLEKGGFNKDQSMSDQPTDGGPESNYCTLNIDPLVSK